MPEAWELAPDTSRQIDGIVNFIIFCEDKVNEPSYFRIFQKADKVKINVIEEQQSNFKNIVNTLVYCESNGLLDREGNKFLVKADVTKHIWSVFDRDVNLSNAETLAADNMQFSGSIQMAENAGVKVAWSNDVFELWILLHFEDVLPGTTINRPEVYARLTQVFKNLPNQSDGLSTITNRHNFYYKDHLKSRLAFNLHVKPLLTSRLNLAIQRAEALEAAFNDQNIYHEMNPCTKVHWLVQSVLSFH